MWRGTVAKIERRLPIGAELKGDGVNFRVCAPDARRVELALENGATVELAAEGNGYFSGTVRETGAGTLYHFRLDGDETLLSDPASRFQPGGPLGPSQVVDPTAFPWSDGSWRGVRLEGQVIYEMHIGTFTPEGTWESARQQLAELARVGITLIEVMPVADFTGAYGWGYDGVNLFAPTRLYGTPDDMRRFVDGAHAHGLGVILDMVYNHLGPVGNYVPRFYRNFFSKRYKTDWGEAINFDGDGAAPVREYYLANAVYWTREFHLDGMRLDATQNIYDRSHPNILAEMSRGVREAAGERSVVFIAENEPQRVDLLHSTDAGGCGLDAAWNDDFHHSARVSLTGHNEAYYTDYLGTPQELVSAVKYGYLYQGQYYKWQGKRRGEPTFGLKPASFVLYLQNHDQLANAGRGERIHFLTSPGRYRAMTALLLLAPGTPMLFQGQEFAASAPFLYFADVADDLKGLLHQSRVDFLAQFPSLGTPEMREQLPRPEDPATFRSCKLDLSERESHAAIYRMHADLLRLRRDDPVFRSQTREVDGAVLGAEAFIIRFFSDESGDRLLVINLGRDLHLYPAPEPLLAPPEQACWHTLWSSEDPRYGGNGTPPLDTAEGWRLPGQAAVVLAPERKKGGTRQL